MQLQSILMPDNRFDVDLSEMYYHESNNRMDFDGYFNLFYIEKRKRYTCIDNVRLNLALKGFEKIILLHNKEEIEKISLNPDKEKNYIFELPYELYESGVFSFSLIKSGPEIQINGFYETDVQDTKEVKIAVDICTFRRETYVARNLTTLLDNVINNTRLDVSDKFDIFVIDNAKTLLQSEHCKNILTDNSNRITVFENMNAGGAGGFTRGIIEINHLKKETGYTHVLLMDDDAVIEPDALVRLYGFLSTLKDEWADISVGGMLFAEDVPNYLYAAGEEWINGEVAGLEKVLDMNDYSNNISQTLLGVDKEKCQYSGWWLCCYSLNVAHLNNLPLPFFIHGDDVEYGVRNAMHGMVFLNGINVWHRRPAFTFSGANLYYDMRNALIIEALHDKDFSATSSVKFSFEKITGMLIKSNYKDGRLKTRGIKDFLKGPELIMKLDPEAHYKDISAHANRMITRDELSSVLPKSVVKKAETEWAAAKERFGSDKQIAISREALGLKTMLTYNGNILPVKKNSVKAMLPLDSVKTYYRTKHVLVVDPLADRALVVTRNTGEWLKGIGAIISNSFALLKSFNAAAKKYRRNYKKMTSETFWRKYLNL